MMSCFLRDPEVVGGDRMVRLGTGLYLLCCAASS
jgi:hypothetical protein